MKKLPAKFPKRIFFVHQGRRSFFDRDVAILKSFAEVDVFDNYPPSITKFFSMIKLLPQCDLVYIWFMGRHAVLPLLLAKVLRKKIVLIAGGWDVANCPEIDYGLMRPSSMRPLIKLLFKLPDVILSISQSNQRELFQNVGVPAEKSKMIYLGFAPVVLSEHLKKEKMVLTVGEVNENNLKRKGKLKKLKRVAKGLNK